MALGLIVVPGGHSHNRKHAGSGSRTRAKTAYALGTPKWKVILTMTLKSARAG